jgi:hypothetical protein
MRSGVSSAVYSSFYSLSVMVRASQSCSLGFGRHWGMTTEKGKFMKKAAAVVAGAILCLGGAAPAFADSEAVGAAYHSPGVLSGNVVQIPVHVPINVCGNTISVIGALNPALGNKCENGG